MERIGKKKTGSFPTPKIQIIVCQICNFFTYKESEVYRSAYLSHHNSLLLHKLCSSICIVDKFIICDTVCFRPSVGANFVLGSCCCVEPNVWDSERKLFYKHEAIQMSLPTVKWLFSITDT